MPLLVFLAALLVAPARAAGGEAARILIDGALVAAPAAGSSGTWVVVTPVEDTTGRSSATAAALRAALLLEALAPARGWRVSEGTVESTHTVFAGRLTEDAGALRAYLFARLSSDPRILGGASVVLTPAPVSSAPGTAQAPKAGAERPGTTRWGRLWAAGGRDGAGWRAAVSGGPLLRPESKRGTLVAAALRSPSGRFELTADGGVYLARTFVTEPFAGDRRIRQVEVQASFFRVRPAVRAAVGRLPWCGFDFCPRILVDGGAGIGLFHLEPKAQDVLVGVGGARTVLPEQSGTYWRLTPIAAAGVTFEVNRRLELGVQGEFVLAPDRVYDNDYGGTALGFKATFLFP